MSEHEVIANQTLSAEIMDRVVIGGDLSDLDADQRAEYYAAVCHSLGLNPLTKPFEFLTLNGKLRLYALRDCTDQLRRIHGISIYIANRERLSDIYIVTARAKDRTGREDESTGAVPLGNLKGDALCNALMKGETKAKRRVTLSIAGLGWLDETDIEGISRNIAQPAALPAVNHEGLVGDLSLEMTEGHPTHDQVSSLIEIARSCGIDLISLGYDIRRLMNLTEETKISKKFLREQMTIPQFESCWAYYSNLLKKQVEDDVQDFSGPVASQEPSGVTQTTAETIDSSQNHDPPEGHESPIDDPPGAEVSDASTTKISGDTLERGKIATSQQLAELKFLAQRVGNDSYADVQDMIDDYNSHLPIDVYQMIKSRLEIRKKAKETPQSELAGGA